MQKALLEEFTEQADDLGGIDIDAAAAAAAERLLPFQSIRHSNLAVATPGR